MCNVAVLGFGYWGKNLIRNFNSLDCLRLIVDTNPKRETLAKKKFPYVEFSSDMDAAFDRDDIQAVVVATPAVTHFAIAKKALENGKDVFVEKPLALNVKEGKELVNMAERLGRVLMVGHILQYHPAVIKLGELIADGELGQIRYFCSNRLNMGMIRTEENILWSFAPHDISVMLFLLGERPCEVVCQGGSYLTQGVPDVTMSQFVFPSGVRAHIFVSWLYPYKEQKMVVVGSEKMAVFDDTAENKLVLYPHSIGWKDVSYSNSVVD